MAKEWACPTREDGFANRYTIDLKGLKVLDLNGSGRGVMEWLYVLVMNRPVRLESPMQEIVGMYHPLHEGSENRFVDRMEGLAARRNALAPLKARRQLRGWSQTELASRSGVNVRNIRQYEQNPETIRRAELATVQSLAKALGCRMEDLAMPDVPATD